MPTTRRASLLALILTSFLPVPRTPAAEPVQQGTPHPFVCSDYSAGKVFIVSDQGKAEWEYPAPKCNDLWILPNGNLLFTTGHGVREVTRDKKVVWTFSDHKTMKTIASLQMLDVPGDVTRWEILH